MWRNVVCLVLFCVGCTQSEEYLAVPRLEDPVRLTVAVVSNAALDPISDERVLRILSEASREVQATFGLRVVFSAPVHVRIEDFFARFDSEFARHAARNWIIDFKKGERDGRKLAEGLERDFRLSGSDFGELYRFARVYLLVPPQTQDLRGLAESTAQTHLLWLDRLNESAMSRGQRVITDKPYNEVMYWQAAGYYPLGYDVVITNQILASVESTGAQLHSSLRGGITNGLTSECMDCRYGTFSLLSTFANWSEDPVTRELRGSLTLSEGEAIRSAALVLVHELGHQIFHYGHPYGQSKCVMSPTPLLRFQAWMRDIESNGCVFGSQKALIPGFIKFYDFRRLAANGVPLLSLHR